MQQLDPTNPFRPSVVLSIRVAAIVQDALKQQRPPEHPSLNAWLASIVRDLVDTDHLNAEERMEWQINAETLPRAGKPPMQRRPGARRRPRHS